MKPETFDYQKLGSGKNLVLIHGWGVDSEIWSLIVKPLSEKYCVHLVDLPGFSEQPELDTYSLQEIAKTLLNKLPENAIWCGWSLGGLVATYVAYVFPKRVEKLIQVSASLKFVEENSWLGVKKDVFDLFKRGVQKQPDKTLSRFLSLQAMGSDTVKEDVSNIRSLLKNRPTPKLSALISGLNLLNDVDLRNAFSEVKQPCLTILGKHDSLVPIQNVPALAKLNTNNQIVTFEKSSHAPFISEPDLFIDTLNTFIER